MPSMEKKHFEKMLTKPVAQANFAFAIARIIANEPFIFGLQP